MPERLTTRFIDSLKPSISEQTISDKISALSIRVNKSGAYYFFRHKRFGKIHIGPINEISLADARDIANNFKSLTRKGIDPKQERPKSDPILSEVYNKFITSAEFDRKSRGYQEVFKLRCNKYLISRLGKHRLSEITQDVASNFWKWLKLNADGNNTDNTARQCVSHLSAILQWADESLPNVSIKSNPTTFPKNFSQARRERIFSRNELKLLLDEFHSLPSPYNQFMICVLLTGIRNGELAKMRWSEIETNVSASNTQVENNELVNIWNSPASSNKHGNLIRYVLSDQVIELIMTLPRINSYVFTSGRGDNTHITSQRKIATQIRSKMAFNESWTLHDLRRTLVTYLSESGVPAAETDRFIGKQVSEGAASHAAYDFAPRLIEKKRVADAWVRLLGQSNLI